MDPAAEHDLVLQAVTGDRAALDRLLRVHEPRILQIVGRSIPAKLRSTLSADDVFQEVSLAATCHITSFEPVGEGAFLAWLLRIAKNRLLDLTREQLRQKRGGDRQQIHAENVDAGLGDLLDRLQADSGTPSRKASRKEALQALELALCAMPDDYRNVLTYRYLECLSTDEVAVRMGRSNGAVHVLTHRALLKLREAMGRVEQYLSWKA